MAPTTVMKQISPLPGIERRPFNTLAVTLLGDIFLIDNYDCDDDNTINAYRSISQTLYLNRSSQKIQEVRCFRHRSGIKDYRYILFSFRCVVLCNFLTLRHRR